LEGGLEEDGATAVSGAGLEGLKSAKDDSFDDKSDKPVCILMVEADRNPAFVVTAVANGELDGAAALDETVF